MEKIPPEQENSNARGPNRKRHWAAILSANTYKELENSCNKLLGKPGFEYVSHQYNDQETAPENVSVMIVYKALNKLH